MKPNSQPEVWLRGKIDDIPELLQPVAHALLQAREDIQKYTNDFSEDLLWHKPAERASVGFHLQHITGVLDRMLTYSEGKMLSEAQFLALKNEGNPEIQTSLSNLVNNSNEKIAYAINKLKSIDESTLTQFRTVGRKELPSTVIGLLFHAAEHVQRHVGQLLVTISVLKYRN
mgnify:FL=1